MKFSVKFTLSPQSEAFLRGTQQVEVLLEGIVRETMAQTLLRAIRDRYAMNREAMGTFEENPVGQEGEPTSPAGMARKAKVRAALTLAHGQRKAFFFERIADLLTNARHIQVVRGPNDLVALMGHIKTLEQIKSPAAKQFLSGKRSRSPYGILWRQMEFGTGVYRKPGDKPFVPTRYTSEQGWWYGPRNSKASIHFRGTKAGNLLRTQTGLPYSDDARAFTALFAERIRSLLKG